MYLSVSIDELLKSMFQSKIFYEIFLEKFSKNFYGFLPHTWHPSTMAAQNQLNNQIVVRLVVHGEIVHVDSNILLFPKINLVPGHHGRRTVPFLHLHVSLYRRSSC